MASPPKPAWARAQEAKALKEEEGKQLAFKQAFEATFADVDPNASGNDSSDDDEDDNLARKPIGPIDPSTSTAAGTGVGGGVLSVAATIVVTAKDSDGRRTPHGGAQVRVRVAPGFGVAGGEIEATVIDQNDGTYVATYTVHHRGNYMVSVEVNGRHITGSPIPVFFGAQAVASPPPFQAVTATPVGGSGILPGQAGLLASGALQIQVPTGLSLPAGLGNLPGILPGPTGGAVLPGVGAQLGEVCRMYLDGRCKNTPCRYAHPTLQQLMTAFASGANMGSLTSMPMAPSAAAMAAAQSIAAAQALQRVIQVAMAATANQNEAEEEDDDAANPFLDEPRALKVRNLSPVVTAEQVRQLFGFCGTVVECNITGADAAKEAYVEFEKPEEATAALQLNGMTVGDRAVQVEHTKLVLKKRAKKDVGVGASLQLMQQAIQLQQMQYQQALAQQTLAAQQMAAARNPAKLAADMAKARALELSKQLKALGGGGGDSGGEGGDSPRSLKSYSPPPRMRSPSPRRRRSPPRRYPSRSPPRYGRDGRRYSRDRHDSGRYRDRLDSRRDRDRRDVDYDRDRRRHRSPDRSGRGSSRRRYSRSPSRERRGSRYRSRERPRSRERVRRSVSRSRNRGRGRSDSRDRGVRESRERGREDRKRSASRDSKRPGREERKRSASKDSKRRDERKRSVSRDSKRPGREERRRSTSRDSKRPRARSPSKPLAKSPTRSEEKGRRSRSQERFVKQRELKARSPSVDSDAERRAGVRRSSGRGREGLLDESGSQKVDAPPEKTGAVIEMEGRPPRVVSQKSEGRASAKEPGKRSDGAAEDSGVKTSKAASRKTEARAEGKQDEEAGLKTPKAAPKKSEGRKELGEREKSPGTIERELRAAVERSMRERREASRAEAKARGAVVLPPPPPGKPKEGLEVLEGEKRGALQEREATVLPPPPPGKPQAGFEGLEKERAGDAEMRGSGTTSPPPPPGKPQAGFEGLENERAGDVQASGAAPVTSSLQGTEQGGFEVLEEERAGAVQERAALSVAPSLLTHGVFEGSGGEGVLVLGQEVETQQEQGAVERQAGGDTQETKEELPLAEGKGTLKVEEIPGGEEEEKREGFGGLETEGKGPKPGAEKDEEGLGKGSQSKPAKLPETLSDVPQRLGEGQEEPGFGEVGRTKLVYDPVAEPVVPAQGGPLDVSGENDGGFGGFLEKGGSKPGGETAGDEFRAPQKQSELEDSGTDLGSDRPPVTVGAAFLDGVSKTEEGLGFGALDVAGAPLNSKLEAAPHFETTTLEVTSSGTEGGKLPAEDVKESAPPVNEVFESGERALATGDEGRVQSPLLPEAPAQKEIETKGSVIAGKKREAVAEVSKVEPKPAAKIADVSAKAPASSGKAPLKVGKVDDDDDILLLPSVRKKQEEDEEEGFGVLGGKLPFAVPKAGVKPIGRKGVKPGGISFKLGFASKPTDKKAEANPVLAKDPEPPAGPVEKEPEPESVANGGGLSAAEVQQGLVKSKDGPPVDNGASKELADLKKALIDDDDEEALPPAARNRSEGRRERRHSRKRRHRSGSSELERGRDASSDDEKNGPDAGNRKLGSQKSSKGIGLEDEYYERRRSRSGSRRDERRYDDRYPRDRYRRERYYDDDGGRYEAPDSEEERREQARREGRLRNLEEREEGEDRRAYLQDSDESGRKDRQRRVYVQDSDDSARKDREGVEEGEVGGTDLEQERRERKKRRKEKKRSHKRSRSRAEESDDGRKAGGGLVPYSEDELEEESRREKRRKRKKERKYAEDSGDSSGSQEGGARKQRKRHVDTAGEESNGALEVKNGVESSDLDEDAKKRKRKERKKRKHKHHRHKKERRGSSDEEELEGLKKQTPQSDAGLDPSPVRPVD